MSTNYFETAPDLKAAAGAVFDAHKDTSGVNVQQEMKSSLNVAEQTGKELGKMQEFASQMKERAIAGGGEIQQTNGQKMAGFAVGEAMSYGTVAIATAINPALGGLMAMGAGAKTLHSIASRTSETSFTTAPEDVGKGSKADAKTEESVFTSGGSQTSFQAVAQEGNFGMQGFSFMPESENDGPSYTRPIYSTEANYDRMYDDMIAQGQTPDDILAMAVQFENDPNFVGLQRQYQQHAEIRPQNLHMVASQPAYAM